MLIYYYYGKIGLQQMKKFGIPIPIFWEFQFVKIVSKYKIQIRFFFANKFHFFFFENSNFIFFGKVQIPFFFCKFPIFFGEFQFQFFWKSVTYRHNNTLSIRKKKISNLENLKNLKSGTFEIFEIFEFFFTHTNFGRTHTANLKSPKILEFHQKISADDI